MGQLDSNDVLALSQLDSNYDINVKTQKEVGIQPDDDDVSWNQTDNDDVSWNNLKIRARVGIQLSLQEVDLEFSARRHIQSWNPDPTISS